MSALAPTSPSARTQPTWATITGSLAARSAASTWRTSACRALLPGVGYSLSAGVDPGFIDLVVGSGPLILTWNNAAGSGDGATWDISGNQNWNDGSPAVYTDGNYVIFNDSNNGHYAVTLNTTVTPLSVTFANNTGTYTLTGTGGIAGTGGLTVSGTGTVILGTTNSYSGNTVVQNGTLVVTGNSSLGSGSVKISTGGTLDLGGDSTANDLNFSAQAFYISGMGANGKGAIVNNGPTGQSLAFGTVTLTGNSAIGGTSQWGFGAGSSTLNLNGSTLDKVGTNQISLVSANLENTSATPGLWTCRAAYSRSKREPAPTVLAASPTRTEPTPNSTTRTATSLGR